MLVDHKQQNVFFLKIDIEGREFDALSGSMELLTNSNLKPCYIYIELKIGAVYDRTVKLLKRAGYVEYLDIETDTPTYPPTGKRVINEGNYVFSMTPDETAKCVARGRNAACA